MAFTTRADRNTLTSVIATPSNVGPGTYDYNGKKRTDPSYAPFSSTAIRALDEHPPKYTPGPGEYSSVDQALDHFRAKGAAPTSSAFASRVERLHRDRSTKQETPSPGTYQEGNAWIKNTHSYKHPGVTRRVAFNKARTAPSVPARHQSYGYEEGSTGELVMQGAPEDGHTGRGYDKVGPCDYNPTKGLDVVKVQHGAKAASWSKSRSDRAKLFAPKENPGPGDYFKAEESISRTAGGERPKDESNRIKKSSNFHSRVPRPFQKNVESYDATPGPGTYSIVDTKHAAQVTGTPVEHQFFGSSQKRGFQVNPVTSFHSGTNHKTPGPGSYNADKATINGARRPPMLPGDIAPAFASAVPRFYSNDNGLPGSGQYDEQDNYSLASTVNKKLVSRSGAFGSAASRFRESAATATAHATGAIDLSPGPTSYDPDAGSKARKSSSMFQSKTRRFPVRSAPPGGGQAGRKGEEVPLMDSNTPKYDPTAIGPGTYVLEDTWSANAIKRRSRRQGNVFISQQDRFGGPLPPGAPKSITPGPGRYSHTRERDAFKPFVRQLPGTGFSTQSRRFKASTTVSPGPGSYEASDPNSDMLKRSFNVTVDELGFY